LIAAQQLLSPNEQRRYSAARDLLKKPSQENLAVLEQAIAQEDSKRVKDMMELAFNLIRIKSDNAVDRLAAIEGLSGSVYSEVRAALSQVLERDAEGNFKESDPRVREAAIAAQKRTETKLRL